MVVSSCKCGNRPLGLEERTWKAGAYHVLGLLCLVLDVADTEEQLVDGPLGLLQGLLPLAAHVALAPHHRPDLLIQAPGTSTRVQSRDASSARAFYEPVLCIGSRALTYRERRH